MHYILDGNNIIKHKIWQGTLQAPDDRESLIVFLQSYCRQHPSVKFTVAFDGWAETPVSSGNIKILWSYDATADDVIIRKINSLKHNAIVVSNDNQIRKHAKFAGMKVLKVEEFLSIVIPREMKKTKGNNETKNIPYRDVFAIKSELEKYYEKNQQENRIRKFGKKFQRFF